MKPNTQLPKILSTFQYLQELNISKTEEGDNCFRILGEYCKELKYGNTYYYYYETKIFNIIYKCVF